MADLPPGIRRFEAPEGTVNLEIEDVLAVRGLLGEDLMISFLVCFAAANRLQSLASMGKLSKSAEFPAGKERNLFTVLFFSMGIGHEVVVVLNDLQRALRVTCVEQVDGDSNRKLQGIARRWAGKLKEFRNRWAFHFDRQTYAAAVSKMGAGGSVLAQVHMAGKPISSYFPLADEALFAGAHDELGLEKEAMSQLVRELWRDQYLLAEYLLDVFMETLPAFALVGNQRSPNDVDDEQCGGVRDAIAE